MMNWARSSFRKKKKDEDMPPEEEINIRPKENEGKVKKKKSITSILSPSCTKGNTLESEPYKRSTASVAGETANQDSLVVKKKSRNLLKRITSKRHSKQSLSSLSIAEEGRQDDDGSPGDSSGTPPEKMRKLSSSEEENEVSVTRPKQQKVDLEDDSVDIVKEEHNGSESVSSGNSNAPKCMEVSEEETRPIRVPALSGPHTEEETKASLDKVTPTDCLAVSLDQTTATASADKLSESDTKNADPPQNFSTKLLSSHANNSGQVLAVRAPPLSPTNRNSSSSSNTEEQQPGIGSDNSSSRQAGKVSIEVNNSEEGKEHRHRPSLGASGTAAVDQSQTLASSVCGGTASGEARDLGTAGTSQDRASKPSSTSPSPTTLIDEPQVEQEIVLERIPLSKVSGQNDQNLIFTDDIKNRGSLSSGKRNFSASVGVTTPKNSTELNSNQVGKLSPLNSATGNCNPGVVSGGGDNSRVGPSNKELECLGALLDSIIVDGEESGGAHQNSPVVTRSSAQGGKVTYEVGGASGKEVSVSIGADFNKSASERVEVVEEPLTKKYFAPLTVNEEKKSLNNTSDSKDINAVNVPNSGVSVDKVVNDAAVTRPITAAKDDKKFNSDSLLDDIIGSGKEINSGVVVGKKSAYGGKVTYEIGGESAKVVTVNISDDFNKSNSVEVVEEPIAKKYFAPLGDEEEKSVTGDAKLSTKDARPKSPSKKVPSKENAGAVGLHEKELEISEASDDLGHLLAELETAIEDLEHLKAVPVVDYSNGVAVKEEPCTKKRFTPLTPEDDLRRREDATLNDVGGSIEDVTKLQRLSTHEISSTDAKYTSPETFYTPMNVFKVLGSLKSVTTADKLTTQTSESEQPTNTPSTTADHRISTKSTVVDKSLEGNQADRVKASDSVSEHTTPSSSAAGGSSSGADRDAGDEDLETMDLVQGRAGLRHHQHVKDRFVHFSSPGVAVLRSQRSHPPITEEPSSGSPIRHAPASVTSSLTKIESSNSSSSTTSATTGPGSGDKSSMGAASAKKITESAAGGDVLRATLAEEEEFDDIDVTVGDMRKCVESRCPEEEGSKIIENQKNESRSCQAKVDVVSVAADDKVLLDKCNKKEVPFNFHLKREVSESSSKEKESKSPVAKYGFGVFKPDSKHSRHGSDKRKSKSPERKDATPSNHHGKDASSFKIDENCNENRPTIIIPTLELEHVDDKEGASKENGSHIGGRPSPVPPVLITVTAATPVKIKKQFSGYEVQSIPSDSGEEAAPSDRACAVEAEIDDVTNSEVAKSPPKGLTGTNGEKDEANPFGDEDDDEVISIELQRESSVKLQNRINVTLSKSGKNEVTNQDKTPQPLKPEQEKPEHVVNIRKEIEKLNKRMEENNTSRKSLPSSDRNSATKFDQFKPIAKSSPESNRGKVLHGVTPPVSPTEDSSRKEDLVNGNVVPSITSPSKKGAGVSDTPTKTELAAMIVNATSPEKISSSERMKVEPPVEAKSNISTLEHSSNTSPDVEGPIRNETTNRLIATVEISSDPKLPEQRSSPISGVEAEGPITIHEESKSTERREPPLQVQPSTESYLTPCKELLESSSQKIVSIPVVTTCSKNNQSLNPFEDSDEDVYEESDEDPITVIHSTPKLVHASKPIPAPKPTPAPKPPTLDTTNPFGGDDDDDEEDDAEIIASLNGTSNPDVSRPPVPSPLPRTALKGSLSTTPVPTPRTTKPGSLSGSCRSVNNSPDSQKQNHYQNTGSCGDNTNGDGSFGGLRSALNVSTMSTKSLNPFDESEEDDEANTSRERIGYGLGSKKKIGGSQYSLRGDFSTMGDFTRNPHRGSLPIRRNKRRAPLPPGMQAPAPSPAHSAITPTASLPPPGAFTPNPAKGLADGLMAHNPSARRATWGNSPTPRKTPPPRPPPPSPMAGRILQQNS